MYKWVPEVSDELPTLRELYEKLPPHVGFNIELKTDEHAVPRGAELEAYIDAILGVSREFHSSSRRVFFSSFDPEVALAMRLAQEQQPVLLLTDAAEDGPHADPRRNSIAAAIDFVRANRLDGVVAEVSALLQESHHVDELHASGLLIMTYGTANVDPQLAVLQAGWGVHAIITDHVESVKGGLTSLQSRAAAYIRRPVAAAASAARPVAIPAK
mmetsp:Transcript_9648/g.31617  ORF Transcript_9648/g.31617 Transcript_9648/m.31617 type:complete len:214 (+) Transcript_9648:249-890(+)